MLWKLKMPTDYDVHLIVISWVDLKLFVVSFLWLYSFKAYNKHSQNLAIIVYLLQTRVKWHQANQWISCESGKLLKKNDLCSKS